MWFTENPWPPMILLGMFGLGFVMLAFSTQRPRHFVIAGICIALCGVVWVVEQQIITDGERIEASILDLADAFHQNDEVRMLSHFSPQNAILIGMATTGMALVDLSDDYRITDISVDVRAEGTLAESVFRANATVTLAARGNIGYHPSRWRVMWRKEADQWKIVEVHRMAIVGDEEMPPLTGTN